MTDTLTGFAALAVFGFMLAFGLLLLFMVLVQPIWCVVDCAVDNRRNGGNKALWIILLLVFWGVANWFYGAFSAGRGALRRLTRLAWISIIVLVVAFFALYFTHAEFRKGIEHEWHKRPEFTVQAVEAQRA
jgi:hypothetical protein